MHCTHIRSGFLGFLINKKKYDINTLLTMMTMRSTVHVTMKSMSILLSSIFNILNYDI